MAAEREGQVAPETPKTREEALRDLFTWVQEHASFCSAVVSMGAMDPLVLATLQPGLKASLERGRQLLESCAPESKDSIESSAYLAAVAASPSLETGWGTGSRLTAPRRQPHLPLSGMNRFTEDSAARAAGFRPIHRPEGSLSGAKAPAEAVVGPAPTSFAPTVAGPARTPPLPSRTYLKKSGS